VAIVHGRGPALAGLVALALVGVFASASLSASIVSGGALTVAPPGTGPSPGGGLNVRPTHPSYVILVHGWDLTTQPAWYVWSYGVDLEQQLEKAGYIVGVASYYGTFTLGFSNGTVLTDPSFLGTPSTPIENISLELGKMIDRAFAYRTVYLDLVGHSMGGLVIEYMLEHVRLSKVLLRNVIFLGSPLNGAPLSSLTPWLNLTGYQAQEMSIGSPFLTALQAGFASARSNYPGIEWLCYAGDADPLWAWAFFSGQPNDGLVEVASAETVPHNHAYVFADLHVPNLDVYSPGSVSYFEDQRVADEMLDNFAGHYY
jgi:hypothetical protein